MTYNPTAKPPNEKALALSRIAVAWNEANIEYGVAHGLENYPEFGRDLDILVHHKHLKKAIAIAVQILKDSGFAVALPRSPWYPQKLIFAAKGDLLLQIDLFPSLSWAATSLVDQPNAQLEIGAFKVDPWASVAKRILMNLLSGNHPKEAQISQHEAALIAPHAQRLLGKQASGEFLDALEAGSDSRLLAMAATIRRQVLLAGVSKPLQLLKLLLLWPYKEVRPHFGGLSPITALVGPDGVGKSTIVERLPAHLPEVFLSTELRHWHPNLLPRLGDLFRRAPGVTTTEDGLILPRRTPGRFQALRLMYYWLDFFLGYFLKDRRASSALKLVLYDRCALDMVVDPLRYGLSSARGTRLLWRLIPKPDLVILLHDDPERIHARKPELPVDEIARQNERWLQLAAEGEVDAIIRVDAGPEEIAARVKELIIEAFIARNTTPAPGERPALAWLREVLSGEEG